MNVFDTILTYNLGITDGNAKLAAIIFIATGFLSIALRIVTFAGYSLTRSGFLLYSRDILKKKDDPRTTKSSASPFTAKIVADYASIGESGVVSIDAGAIVYSRLNKLGLLGISYVSIGNFVDKFEQASIFIGLVLAIIYESPQGIAVISVAMYVIFRLLAMIFDFQLAKEKLAGDVINFVEKEVGKYYGSDAGSAIARLKVEMVAAIGSLGAMFEKSMNDMAAKLGESVEKSMVEVANSVNFTMESLSKYTEYMDEPFEKWKIAVENTNAAQNKLYEIIDGMTTNVADYAKVQNSIEANISAFSQAIDNQAESVKIASASLKAIAEDTKNNQAGLEVAYNAIESQLAAYNENQESMEKALVYYEESLKEITGNISGGVGSIIGVHVQNAYNELNDALKDNIETMVNSNNNLTRRIEAYMEEIARLNNSK